MLQILTLDGWGQIGRDIITLQDFLSSLWLVIFIFVLFFFFWNILIGILLDIFIQFREDKEHFHNKNNQIPFDPEQEMFNDASISNASHLGHMKLQHQRSIKMHQAEIESMSQSHLQSPLYNQLHQKVDSYQGQFQKQEEKTVSENNFSLESLLFGKLYQIIFLFLWFMSQIIVYNMNNIQLIQQNKYINIQIIFSSVYTLHTIAYIVYKLKHKIKFQLLTLHIISGPMSLFLDVFELLYTQKLYGFQLILQSLKILTIPGINNIVLSAKFVLPILLPPLTAIMGFICIIGIWGAYYLNKVGDHFGFYWQDFRTSFYTFVQVLTLDDWCAKLLKMLNKEGYIFEPLFFIAFIFMSNYFFLNIIISFSSQCFSLTETEEQLALKPDFYEREKQSQEENSFTYKQKFEEFKKDFHHIQTMLNTEEQLVEYKQKKMSSYLSTQQIPVKIVYQGQEVYLQLKDLHLTP
ncbi:hypothetical protein PPERSA_10177 [Pseudocohnilembus persalinus]|uniref:Uncharacterized protein n=1 Tax=Pseudocohnilembus persalinus TaxID=266149 RepID=A0A0V0QLZ1_PSEPJ|nr:hypothetical protein PPERSA_10177 [Pseudocohnilembus persalinus]|eukprot:KRX03096.1 hypothetical protein PPERSA_10177 [Pseudocohnilembus persalinus]